MMPVYKYMDSHPPHQRTQLPFPQYYYPNYDAIPPQMVVDQAKSYECWPHGSNYGRYSNPYHACCNHGNFPGYYGFRPPFSHYPPAPPVQCCGYHPSFTESYPVPYALPPHHAMEQPRYEYDKDVRREHHCCGCPNHMCNQRNDMAVRIEEQEPDAGKKTDSLVPFQMKNYPYPVMWIPPEYMKRNNDLGNSFKSEMAEQDTVPRTTKPHIEEMKSSEREPRAWNGWFPLDMNNLKPLVQGEDEKNTQNQQSEDKMRQFPYPIVWMPSNNEQDEAEKNDRSKKIDWFPLDMNGLKSLMQSKDENRTQNQQNEDKLRQLTYPILRMPSYSEQREAEKDPKGMNSAHKPVEEPPSNFKFIPVKPSEGDGGIKKPGGPVKSSQKMENTANLKIIPVKQVEEHRVDNSEGTKKKVSDVPVKNADGPSGTSVKRQSSSPPKTAKLPPVCLRVEPFRKKKIGNGSSRSPSPPGLEGRSQQTSKDTSKPSALSSLQEKSLLDTHAPNGSLKKSGEVRPKQAVNKTIDVVDGKACENKIEEFSNGCQMTSSVNPPVDFQEEIPRKSAAVRSGEAGDECKSEEDKRVGCEREMIAEETTEANKATDSAKSAVAECGAKIKNLSDEEAAMLIQSVYRGFEVRKLELLKKLKQMAKIREQVAEVRNDIKALESSSDLQKNDKQRVVIGEMIMRLLLELDTIQGLNPSLKDIRKALARELVSQQEKLDSLTMKKSRELLEEVPTTKHADDPRVDTSSNVSMLETKKDEAMAENCSETSCHNEITMKVQDQDQVSQMVPNSQDEDISEVSLADKEVHGSCENVISKLPVASGVESQVSESAPNMELEEKAASEELDDTQVVISDIREGNNLCPELDQQSIQLPVSEEKTSSEECSGSLLQGSQYDKPNGEDGTAVSGGVHMDEGQRELPLNMMNELQELDVSKLEKDELAGKGENEIVHDEELCPTSHNEIDNMTADVNNKTETTEDSESILLAELPHGVLEEDQAVAAFENRKQIEREKDEIPSVGEAGYNVPLNDLELQPLEAEPENLAKATGEELSGNAAPEIEDIQPLISIGVEERIDEGDGACFNEGHGMLHIDHTPSLESAVTSDVSQDLEEKKEQVQEEEVLEEKPQNLEPECVIGNDKMHELPIEPETTMEDSPVPVGTESTKTSVHEADIEGYKLIEENAKLREMMQKLMEAGKEQLTVICNLTGRVKDLERKLSRKKKLKTKRNKRAPPAM